MGSDVEVLHVEGILFDEFAALLDVFTHQRGEHLLRLDYVLELHFQQRARLGVHGGGPQLLGIHFAQALEARNGEVLLGVLEHESEDLGGALFGHLVTIARDRERRLIRSRNGPAERAQSLPVLPRGERPIDSCGVARAVTEHQLVKAMLFVVRKFGFHFEFGLLDGFQQFLERLLIFEIGLLLEIACRDQVHQGTFPQPPEHFGRDLIIFLHIEKEPGERGALKRDAFFGLDDVILGGPPHQFLRELALVADVAVHLAALDAIEGRLGDIHMPPLDELFHVAKEKRQQQGADVAAVHVRVGHQDHFVITQAAGVEIVLADSRSQGGDDGADFLVAQHLVVACLLHVQDLSFKGQDSLIAAVAALLGRAAGGFALHDKNLAIGWIALLAIGQFPGQASRIHGRFSAGQFARLAGRLAGPRRVNALSDNAARDGGVLIEVFPEPLINKLLHLALDIAIELAFSLSFELRLGQLHGYDRDQSFADVIASDRDAIFLFLEHTRSTGEVVDRPRQRGTESGKMRAAIDRVDGIGEGKDVFRVAIVILQRDLHLDVIALAFDVNRGVVKRLLAAIEVLDEFHDSAGEAKLRGFFAALILKRDLQAFIQESQFAQALRQDVIAEFDLVENASIGVKRDLGAGFARLAGNGELRFGHSAFIGLFPNLAVSPDLQIQPIGKRVDDGNAHAMQAAGNFVGFTIEFSAGVKNGHDHFGSGLFFRGVHVYWDAAAVVRYGDAVVVVNDDVDFVAVASHGFVHRVIHHFRNQFV